MRYLEILEDIIRSTRIHISDEKPSEWYEKNMVMPKGSAFPGPFSFDLTPYWREPLDCADKNHPAKEISIMKGAQLGGTVAVLNPIVGYTIAKNPGNIMFLTGHSDLTDASVLKIDQMIDACNMRHLIKPNVMRARNTRSGDTNRSKEFLGGDFKSGSVTNHNLLRQHDVMVMIVDDYDAAAGSSKAAGATRELVQKRTSAFAHKRKIFYVSSPQLKGDSNIEEVFLLGDQRYYNVHCPCCHNPIVLEWSVKVNDHDNAGIFWKTDNMGRVIRESVGYVCQICAGFFTDSHKYEMNINGFWHPTVSPKEENHWSYHLSSLYAPAGMDDWAHYAAQYQNAHSGEKRDERKIQTFLNVVLGQTYEPIVEELSAKTIMANTRKYKIGIVPESLSLKDGNGKIVLLVLACDLNGKVDDARLDYEVVAWSEKGSSYSIVHGSIGTFVPRESMIVNKEERVRWTYQKGRANCVWNELDRIKSAIWETDTGRKMKVMITGVDTGYSFDGHAYNYVDEAAPLTVSLKGKDRDKFVPIGRDSTTFKFGKEKTNLFLAENLILKDELASRMQLKWDDKNDEFQPAGFMNFPEPSDGLYGFKNYFEHFEAEHRVIKKDDDGNGLAARWEKKTVVTQNHFYDVHLYAMVLKDIIVALVYKELKQKPGSWSDFASMFLGKEATLK